MGFSNSFLATEHLVCWFGILATSGPTYISNTLVEIRFPPDLQPARRLSRDDAQCRVGLWVTCSTGGWGWRGLGMYLLEDREFPPTGATGFSPNGSADRLLHILMQCMHAAARKLVEVAGLVQQPTARPRRRARLT